MRRPARQAARFKPGAAAAANGDAHEDEEGEDGAEDGAGEAGELGDARGWRSSVTDDDDDADGPTPDSVVSGAGYHRSPFFRSGCAH